MTVKDIYKLIEWDNMYDLELQEYINGGEWVSLRRTKDFTEKDWNKQINSIGVIDETIDRQHPSIIILCYLEQKGKLK